MTKHELSHQQKEHRTQQRAHAKLRLLQRFGVVINTRELEKLAQKCRKVINTFKSPSFKGTSQSGKRYVRLRVKGGDFVIAVYDQETRMIATFITEEQHASATGYWSRQHRKQDELTR